MPWAQSINRKSDKFITMMQILKDNTLPFSITVLNEKTNRPCSKTARYYRDYYYNIFRNRQREENIQAKKNHTKPFIFTKPEITQKGTKLFFKEKKEKLMKFKVGK